MQGRHHQDMPTKDDQAVRPCSMHAPLLRVWTGVSHVLGKLLCHTLFSSPPPGSAVRLFTCASTCAARGPRVPTTGTEGEKNAQRLQCIQDRPCGPGLHLPGWVARHQEGRKRGEKGRGEREGVWVASLGLRVFLHWGARGTRGGVRVAMACVFLGRRAAFGIRR